MTRVEDLRRERCVACRRDAVPLLGEELDEMLLMVPDWDLITIDGVPRLERRFPVKGWRAAMLLTNQVGDLALVEDHHPVIRTEWGAVTVTWWTHIIRNLHRNDVLMAARTDAIADDPL